MMQPAATEHDVIKYQEEFRTEPLKPGQLVWKRFLQHKMAVFGAVMLILLVLYSFVGAAFYTEAEANFTDTSIRLQGPNSVHPFGTDTVGRD
ncbi:MAG: hypothetical protein IH629_04990, partial [Thermoleophilia bacterium]|nr:hypothetical protein [Thermoleophilia bacterium]